MGRFEELGKAIDREFDYHQEQICALQNQLENNRQLDVEFAQLLRYIADKLENK